MTMIPTKMNSLIKYPNGERFLTEALIKPHVECVKKNIKIGLRFGRFEGAVGIGLSVYG